MSEFLSYKNIGVSADRVWEASRGRIVEEWKRAELSRCLLQRGSPEQRPFVSAILGLLLLIPGGFFVQHMVLLVTEGRCGNLRYEAVMLMLGFIGAWLFIQALVRKRYYLLVSMQKGENRKLVFSADADLNGVKEFLSQAAGEYHFQTEDNLKTNA